MAWYKKWFDTPYYHILYKNRNFDEAEQFISRLVSYINLPKKSTVVDLACGKGRHSVYLNYLGYSVIGLDLSENSIQHNKQYENETLQFAVHDMRNPMDYKNVDAVLNLFTSFGYFDDASDDSKVFQSVSKSLKTNGLFVLDFLNQNYVKSNIVHSEMVSRDSIDFSITRRVEDDFIIKDIRFSDDGDDFHFFEKVKLHSIEEIRSLASKYGFLLKDKFGDYQLNSFDAELSPRCILIFTKL